MVATYTAAAVTTFPAPSKSDGSQFISFGSISLTSTLTANDLVLLCNVPNGYKILSVILDSDALDAGASAALKWNVGDASATSRFINQAAIGGGGTQQSNVGASTGYVYAVVTSGGNAGYTTIQAKCMTAASTWAAGYLRCLVELSIDNPSFA